MGNTASDSIVIRNIFYMLAYATGSSGQDAKSSLDSVLSSLATEEFASYLDVIAALLVNTVDSQRLRGFERVYNPTTANLTYVKGRVMVRESYLQRARGSLQLSCSFEELSENSYMNRILKTTIKQLLKSSDLIPGMRRKLLVSWHLLDQIQEIEPREINWGNLRFSRLNQSYQLIMSLCRMILERSIPRRGMEGHIKFPDLFSEQRLASLFEHFVLSYFKRHYPSLGASSRYVDFGVERRVGILPRLHADIVLFGKGHTLIIDTKCYGKILQTNCEKKILSPEHRNQILAYVMHLDAKQHPGCRNKVGGMLLYAQTSLDGKINETWEELGHTFQVMTLDLGTSFANISMQLNSIADSLLDQQRPFL